MKKIYKIIITILILIPSVALAQVTAPNGGTGLTSYTAGDIIYAATTNPIRFTKLPIGVNGSCLGVSAGIPSYIPCSPSDSISPWATTTSSVPSRLIVYPKNNTDIVTIGSNSTTTSPYWFDPNTQISYLSGNVGIASSSPSFPLSIIGDVYQRGGYIHLGTADSAFTCKTFSVICAELVGNDNTTGGVLLQLENKNAGASAYGGFVLLNDLAYLGNNASYYAGMFLNSSGYSDPTFGQTNNVPNILQVGNTMGSIVMQASSTGSTASYISFVTGGVQNANERGRFTNSGLGIGTTSPIQKLEVSNGNIFISSPNGQGRGLTISTDVMDDTSRPSIKFLRNNFAAFLGDDHANQTFNFMTTLSSTRVFNSTLRAYGSETGGFTKYAGITHDGTVGSVTTGFGDLVLSPATLKVGIGTSSPATELNVAATLPEITLSDIDATTNLKHWFIESDSGTFAIGTTSDQLVKTTTRPFSISSTGQIAIGHKDSLTSRLVVTGSALGTSLITLVRPGVAQFSWALAGGGLSFADDLTAFTVANLFGDVQQNQIYIGSRGLPTPDGRTDILSGTTFSSAAGTDVKGHPLEIVAGRGTGAGTPGDLRFSTGIAGSSGTTAQSTSTRMFISGSTGNVGIGTTSPTISGTSLSNFIIGSAAATNVGMALDGSSAGTGLRYGFASNGTLAAGILRNNSTATLTISNSSANATDIVIGSTGNVGVATTSPAVKLDVYGQIRPTNPTKPTCTAAIRGSIQYDVSDDHFYGCRVSGWAQLDN